MTLKFHETPFHATESKEIADKLAIRADLCVEIRDKIEDSELHLGTIADWCSISLQMLKHILEGDISELDKELLCRVSQELDELI